MIFNDLKGMPELLSDIITDQRELASHGLDCVYLIMNKKTGITLLKQSHPYLKHPGVGELNRLKIVIDSNMKDGKYNLSGNSKLVPGNA